MKLDCLEPLLLLFFDVFPLVRHGTELVTKYDIYLSLVINFFQQGMAKKVEKLFFNKTMVVS